MKLTVNKDKSCLLNGHKESFDFLGFTFRYTKGRYNNKNPMYWNVEPSAKSQNKIRGNIREYLRHNRHRSPDILSDDLNAIIRGWINYFSIEKVSYPVKAKRNLRYYMFKKLHYFYKRKSQRKCKLYSKGAMYYLNKHHSLLDPSKYIPKRLAVNA